jgi:hypothetical protein
MDRLSESLSWLAEYDVPFLFVLYLSNLRNLRREFLKQWC